MKIGYAVNGFVRQKFTAETIDRVSPTACPGQGFSFGPQEDVCQCNRNRFDGSPLTDKNCTSIAASEAIGAEEAVAAAFLLTHPITHSAAPPPPSSPSSSRFQRREAISSRVRRLGERDRRIRRREREREGPPDNRICKHLSYDCSAIVTKKNRRER